MAHSTKELQSPGTKSLVGVRTAKIINLNKFIKMKNRDEYNKTREVLKGIKNCI